MQFFDSQLGQVLQMFFQPGARAPSADVQTDVTNPHGENRAVLFGRETGQNFFNRCGPLDGIGGVGRRDIAQQIQAECRFLVCRTDGFQAQRCHPHEEQCCRCVLQGVVAKISLGQLPLHRQERNQLVKPNR